MAIYRGTGGTGDSNTDSTISAVTTQATNAANSASAAASSASSASSSASAASGSASTATTKASDASASASAALTSQNSAAADLALTNADVVLTNADVVSAEADKVQTGLDRVATAADATTTSNNASTATTKASEASSSASAASGSASTSSTKASEAAASASAASSSETNAASAKSAAESAQTAAEAALDSFDDVYLGAKGSAPTLDNDGDALAAGSLYFDTVSNTMKVYSGSSWVDAYASLSGALLQTGGAMTGAITTNSTFDGRDVATDGTKLDTIETSATADQSDAEIRTAVEAATDSNVFTDADHTKLNAIEALADVTDVTNVAAAGALMDSEVTNLASVKTFDTTDYATATQGSTADAALPKAGGALTGAITTNSTFDGRNVATDGTKLDTIVIGTSVLAPTGDGSGLTGIDSLPTQTSNSGKFLTTNGSAASWVTNESSLTSKTVTANQTLDSDTRYTTGKDFVVNTAATLIVPLNSLLEVKSYGNNKQL